MRENRYILLMLAMVLLLSGCTTGLLYTHTFQPVTLDMHRTPVTENQKTGSIKLIALQYPLVAWDSAAIGDVAKKQGMQEVFFADVETFSILRIWNEYTIHVYGK
jgi:hypothetical protein